MRSPIRPILLMATTIVPSLMSVVAAATLVSQGAQDRGLADDPAPVTVTITPTPTRYESTIDVEVAVKRREPDALLFPATDGVITSMFAVPHVVLTNGDPVFRVNDSTVRILVSPTPLYRSVTSRSRGVDYDSILGFLAKLYPAGTDAPFRDQVLWFQSADGWPDRDGVFRPEYVVWTPNEHFLPAQIDAQVGIISPAQGSVLAKEVAEITGVTLESVSGDSIASLIPPSADIFLEMGDRSIKISLNDEAQPVMSESLGEFLAKSLGPESADGAEPSIRAAIKVVSRSAFYKVPTSAVLFDEYGVCLLENVDGMQRPQVLPVEVYRESLGASFVSIDGQLSNAVLVEPLSSPSPSCAHT